MSRGPAVGRTFAALRHPNYRFWFVVQLVSLFGTWMQSTAQGFLVFEITRSPAYLGLSDSPAACRAGCSCSTVAS